MRNTSYQNTINNAKGQQFEKDIEAACLFYAQKGIAVIHKTPEPFRVSKKNPDGTFSGRFTNQHAQPDFQGTLAGGRSIVFEAKYTTTDKLHQNILTETQSQMLEEHSALGARAGVCTGIKDRFYFVPWEVWQNMKTIFGRKYVTANDLAPYRVKYIGAVLFLDEYLNGLA